MSSDKTFIRIDGGKVTRVREVEVHSTPLSDFMDKLADQAPQNLKTPVLPTNTLRYCSVGEGGRKREIFTVFSPPQLVTVAWRARRHVGTREVEHYDVSFPGMVFKFVFDSAGRLADRGKVFLAVSKGRPSRNQDRLYKASIPNIFPDSNEICMVPQVTPGDFAKTCNDTIMNYFTGQAFNDDLRMWPPGTSNFEQWQNKTKEDPRWIEEANWDYLTTFGEFSERPGNN